MKAETGQDKWQAACSTIWPGTLLLQPPLAASLGLRDRAGQVILSFKICTTTTTKKRMLTWDWLDVHLIFSRIDLQMQIKSSYSGESSLPGLESSCLAKGSGHTPLEMRRGKKGLTLANTFLHPWVPPVSPWKYRRQNQMPMLYTHPEPSMNCERAHTGHKQAEVPQITWHWLAGDTD